VLAASVTFQPCARTDWHTHPLGQALVVTAGLGLVQQWEGPIAEIRPGDVVWIPAGVKHWHGASPTQPMTHIAILEQLDGSTGTWMEKVTDAQYHAPRQTTPKEERDMPKPPSGAQALLGDYAPKLVQLTDDVLFSDVWERPGLSKRDRSLATVAALVALNRPDQLRFHLKHAVANGMTREELVELITHLAFYAGWPNAMTSMLLAKELVP